MRRVIVRMHHRTVTTCLAKWALFIQRVREEDLRLHFAQKAKSAEVRAAQLKVEQASRNMRRVCNAQAICAWKKWVEVVRIFKVAVSVLRRRSARFSKLRLQK